MTSSICSNNLRCGFVYLKNSLKLEETMAFGDGGNDISMLRHAAIGIAMGQAKEDVKAAADYVTTPIDEDGISKAMKHFGII